jgi:hypothetical protein
MHVAPTAPPPPACPLQTFTSQLTIQPCPGPTSQSALLSQVSIASSANFAADPTASVNTYSCVHITLPLVHTHFASDPTQLVTTTTVQVLLLVGTKAAMAW